MDILNVRRQRLRLTVDRSNSVFLGIQTTQIELGNVILYFANRYLRGISGSIYSDLLSGKRGLDTMTEEK